VFCWIRNAIGVSACAAVQAGQLSGPISMMNGAAYQFSRLKMIVPWPKELRFMFGFNLQAPLHVLGTDPIYQVLQAGIYHGPLLRRVVRLHQAINSSP
jgi:hypothetical protein